MSATARYATAPTPGAASHGPAVARLAAALGKPLMPWQRQVVDVGLELNDEGTRYRYSTVVVSVPRQSGKTTLLGPVMLHRALTVPDAGVWFTAQTRNDVRDIFMGIVKLVRRSPLAAQSVIRLSNGSEGIELPGGGSIRIFAPGEDNLHGKTCDLVHVDEIWTLTSSQGGALMQAVVPTQLTRPFAQTWLTSTAGTSKSGFMRGIVTQGRLSTLLEPSAGDPVSES